MRRWARVGLDLVVVLAFVAIGRANHHHGETAAGLASTAWPFLVGLACGWALLVARRRPGDRLVDGVAVALVTVAVGMVLRVLVDTLRVVATVLQPFMPDSMARMLNQLGVPVEDRTLAALDTPLADGTMLPPPQGVLPRYVEPAE